MTLQTLQLNSNSWYESAKAAMLAAGKSYTSNRQLTLHKSSYHTLRFLTFPGFDLTFLDLISSQKSSTPTHGVATFVTGLVLWHIVFSGLLSPFSTSKDNHSTGHPTDQTLHCGPVFNGGY